MTSTTYIRKDQPHFQHLGGTFSITIMAHDAVPKIALAELQDQRNATIVALPNSLSIEEVQRKKAEIHSDYEHQLEVLLHARSNQVHLFRKPVVAEIIMDQVRKYDGDYYSLEALCVMSNHVHLLLDFSVQVPVNWDGLAEIADYKNVSDVMSLIKGGSGYRINKRLGKSGSVWSYGYYDRFIRSPRHFEQAYLYIVNNPVKAGLVEHWKDYPYTYLKNRGYRVG